MPSQSVKTKKRKRSRKSGEHPDNNPSKKPVKKSPDKMASPDPNPNPKDPVINDVSDGVELSPELKELEKRLNTSMLININKCIAEALQPIKDSIDKIVNSSAKIDSHDNEIKRLNTENSALRIRVNDLENDMNSIKSRLNQVENKSLECNLIFRGVDESQNETEEVIKDKIHQVISETFNYHDEQSRLDSG